jgi:MFS family permease
VDFAISATAATAVVGTALGIVLAGPITLALDYHYLFWIPLILVVGSTIAALVVFRVINPLEGTDRCRPSPCAHRLARRRAACRGRRRADLRVRSASPL